MRHPGYRRLEKELMAARAVGRAAPERLQAVRLLLEELDSPQRHLKVVHVAGTNGKGLTSHLTACLLEQHTGTQVGLFTSPHLSEIRERIAFGGRSSSEEEFAAAAWKTLSIARRLRMHFSFFDLLTAAALWAFAQAKVHWAVLETGIGGAADATNAINKQLAIITRLGLDHQAILGHTLRHIASEKLAIAPKGGQVVLGAQFPTLEHWITGRLNAWKCHTTKARIIKLRLHNSTIHVHWPDGSSSSSPILFPQQQTPPWRSAAANAFAAGWTLWPNPTPTQRQNWLKAICQTHLPARLDLRQNQSLSLPPAPSNTAPVFKQILLDGAHNPQALCALAHQIRQWNLKPYQLLLVLSKDRLHPPIRRALNTILRRAQRLLLPSLMHEKIAPPQQLQAFLHPSHPQLPTLTFPNVTSALQEASSQPQVPLVATGSFWMIGEILKHIPTKPSKLPAIITNSNCPSL